MAEDRKKAFPWNKAEQDEKMMEGVYAGPSPKRFETDETQFMCVYAGPEYFNPQPVNGMNGMGMAFVPSPEQQPDDRPTGSGTGFCRACGAKLLGGSFCTECGTPVPAEEQKE